MLVVAGLLVMVDLIPRMIIVASEARETAYWEAWEEAYINNEAGAASAWSICLLGASA